MKAEDELNKRMFSALSGLKLDSQEAYQAARGVINSLFADGLLTCLPQWKSDFEVELELRSEIKKIDISVIIKR